MGHTKLFRLGWHRATLLAALAVAFQAAAALQAYEPFDYATGMLQGTPATGLNLAGEYLGPPLNDIFQLSVSAPGLTYGAIDGAPASHGNKLTQVNGGTPVHATIDLNAPVVVNPGQLLYFSALFVFDDAVNGNHLANITLIDDATGGSLMFGEPAAGSRAIRVEAQTAATDGLFTAGADQSFIDGQSMLLIGRYINGALPQSDSVELVGYDTAQQHALPVSFEAIDPNRAFLYRLDGLDIDLTRVSTVSFAIRGTDNNHIDEFRLGSAYADVALVPEPGVWLLMLLGIAGVVTTARRRR